MCSARDNGNELLTRAAVAEGGDGESTHLTPATPANDYIPVAGRWR
jgi:hypothetical protein